MRLMSTIGKFRRDTGFILFNMIVSVYKRLEIVYLYRNRGDKSLQIRKQVRVLNMRFN